MAEIHGTLREASKRRTGKSWKEVSPQGPACWSNSGRDSTFTKSEGCWIQIISNHSDSLEMGHELKHVLQTLLKFNRPSASSSFIEPARALTWLFSQPSSSRFSAAKVEVRKQLQCAGTVWCFWSVLVVFPPALHSFTAIVTMQIQLGILHLPDAKMLCPMLSLPHNCGSFVCGETRFSSFYPCPKVFKLEIRWYVDAEWLQDINMCSRLWRHAKFCMSSTIHPCTGSFCQDFPGVSRFVQRVRVGVH